MIEINPKLLKCTEISLEDYLDYLRKTGINEDKAIRIMENSLNKIIP